MAGVDADRDRPVLGDGHFQGVNAAGCHVDVILQKVKGIVIPNNYTEKVKLHPYRF